VPSPGANDYNNPPSKTTLKSIPSSVDSALQKSLKPGWVVLVLGGLGYATSETHIIGPFLAIVLSAATIYQLNQYFQAKKGSTT
jgi:hypothetical protein